MTHTYSRGCFKLIFRKCLLHTHLQPSMSRAHIHVRSLSRSPSRAFASNDTTALLPLRSFSSQCFPDSIAFVLLIFLPFLLVHFLRLPFRSFSLPFLILSRLRFSFSPFPYILFFYLHPYMYILFFSFIFHVLSFFFFIASFPYVDFFFFRSLFLYLLLLSLILFFIFYLLSPLSSHSFIPSSLLTSP